MNNIQKAGGVAALLESLRHAPLLSQLASMFGVVWVGLVIASGMIANIGLATVIEMAANEPEQAMSVWCTIYAVVAETGLCDMCERKCYD